MTPQRVAWKPMPLRGLAVVALILSVLIVPSKGFALDLDLTSSNVDSLWTNVKNPVLSAATAQAFDDDWQEF